MANTNEAGTHEGRRVTLAWIVLALQIIGLILLLLFARDRLAAMFGAEPAATIAPTAVAAVAEPTADDAPAADSAATAAAESAAATAEAESAASPTEEPTAEPTAAPEESADAAADVLAPEDVVVDPSSLAPNGGVVAPEWLAQLVEGVPPAEAEDGVGIPPHLLLTFNDPAQPELELAAPNSIDLNQPQIRIVPIATLLAWLQARGDTAGQEALEELQSLLDEQPPADEAGAPVPPILSDATQALVAQLGYGEFHDGQGVGYVAHVTGEDVTPVTNESGLNYVYQGITADGRHYVFMAWPMDADFLAEGEADADALAADPAAYYDAVAAQVEAAADDEMSPALSQLRRVAGSLAIGAAAVRAAADQAAQPQPTVATPEEAAGIVWNWTSSRGGDGDETSVENPQNYALVFWPDGSFNFMADCNVGRGDYSVADDGTLSLEPGAMTRAACDPGSQDAEFLQTLPAARGLALDESGDLILTLADGREAIFANTGQADTAADAAAPEDQPAAADAGFTGINLHWPGFTAADGTTVAVENPEDYSLVLLPDGTYTLRADCNVGAGTFTYDDDGALTLLPGPLTMAACPEGSQSDAFLNFLSGVDGVSVADDGAVTMTTADGGSATFVNAGPVVADEEPGAGDPLVGTVWQWTGFEDTAELNDLTVDDPPSYLLTFWPDDTFSVKADCNVGRGSYTRDGSSLALTVGPMTRAACGPESLGDRFPQFLNATATYVMDEDDQLVLNLMADSGNLVFANGGPAEMPATTTEPAEQPTAASAGLTGVTLQWPGFSDAGGNLVEVDNPENYTLVLLPDGTFTFSADCNVGTGTYSYDADGALTLVPGAMTRMACPAGSQADAFLSFLNDASGVTLDDEGNPTVTTADGGSATFVNIGPAEAPAAEPPAAQEGELLNTVWQWTAHVDASATATAVENPERYTLAFLDDGSYVFVADCNRGSGSYTRDGQALTLLPGAMTLAACEAGSLSDEFVGTFEQVAGYAFEGDGLLLRLADGTALALDNGGPFDATATGGATAPEGGNAAPLAGVTWRWATFRDAKQDYVVPATADYTLVFNDDGTVNVVADCNNGNGTYTVNSDATLTIVVRATTDAACPPGSLSDSFIEYLNQAGPFAVGDDGLLTIELMADGGTMTFAPEE